MVAKLARLFNIDTSAQALLGPLAKCRDKKYNMFPEGRGTDILGKERNIDALEDALGKEVCFGAKDGCECPVREACLEYAILNREPYGVWGGFGSKRRRKIARARRKQGD